jgi:ABC-type uncharacterized transport system auxiliary subunit
MSRIQPEHAGAKHNNTKRIRRISHIVAICLLGGMAASCAATPPTKYYVLDEPPAPAPAAQALIPVRLIVGRITSSHLYRDDRLVYGTGEVELGTYEYQRWAEPPVDLIQDMLLASLRNSGQYRAVSRIGSAARGDYIVRGHLDALDEIDNKPGIAARFAFQLELFDPSTGTIVWSGSYSHDEPVEGKHPSVADVVQALDRNVAAGIQQLASGLSQYLASHAQPPSAGN